MINHSNMKHILHLEEFVLVPNSVDFIKDVLLSFKDINSMKLSHKMDGAPAIYFGYHPENGKFFVGTKSIFNSRKEKIFNYSNADIINNYPSYALELKSILIQSLKYLEIIYPNDGMIYQCDILYTNHLDKEDEGTCISFKPNTVKYIVSKDDGDHFQRIRESIFGVAIHTVSKTLNLDDFLPIEDISRFNTNKDVYIDNLDVKSNEDINTDILVHLIDRLDRMNYSNYKHVYNIDVKLLRQYFNTGIRENHKAFSFDSLVNFIKNKYETKISSYKKKETRIKYINILFNIVEELLVNEHHYRKMLYMYEILSDFKDIVLSLLVSSNHKYMYCIDGKLSGPEGYVLVHDGIPIKLVDRYEFSINNFNR